MITCTPLRHRHRIARWVAVAVVGLTFAGGCYSTPSDFGENDHGTGVPAGATITPQPPLPAPWNSLDRTDPAAVAVAAIQAVFDWHPERGEIGPEIAARRAAPLFTAGASSGYRVYPISRPTWQTWMENPTTISAQTVIGAEEHPADTEATWQRKVSTTVTITATGKPPMTITVISLVSLQKQSAWTISALAHLT